MILVQKFELHIHRSTGEGPINTAIKILFIIEYSIYAVKYYPYHMIHLNNDFFIFMISSFEYQRKRVQCVNYKCTT